MGCCLFVSGGARSGKSSYAERRAAQYSSVTYIATALNIDPEMNDRIATHRARRPEHWKTVEAYRGVGKLIAAETSEALILDCLTVMTTNLMLEAPLCPDMDAFDWDALTRAQAAEFEKYVLEEMLELRDGIARTSAFVILVTNELGMGLVPPNPLGRAFRDITGRVNSLFAELADEAVLMVSGLPLKLK